MVVFTLYSAIATGFAVSAVGGSFIAGFLQGGALKLFGRIALGLALNALTPKPKLAGANRGYQVNSSGSALDHQIIYGKMRVGGAIVYDESTGVNNKFFHRIIAVAGHEVESFDRIYINESYIDFADLDSDGNVPTVVDADGTTSTRYNDKVRIQFGYGTPTQAANADLVAESEHWTAEHKLSGIAYMYVRLKYNSDAFPNGVPNITAEVKGKKLFNPATSATAWSDNPALCLRDYLTSSYGLGEAVANIDDTLVNTAVTVCNALVGSPVIKMQVGGEYKIKTVGNTDFTLYGSANNNVGTVFTATSAPAVDSGDTGVVEIARYTCNGAFTTALTPYELLGDLLTCMGGSLWYSQGKWRMKPAYYTSTVMDLNEDDLRSGIDVSTRHSRRDNFNTVKGTFRGQESNWQVTDYPEITNSVFVSADGGQESVADVDLPFTDNSIEARRIARISLESNRQQLTINAAFGLRTLGLQVGDNVRLTNTRFGWTDKEFQVLSWSFGLTDGLDLQVNMTLRETAASVYDEVDDAIVYERDNTTLFSPFEVPNLGINISTELRRVKGKTLGVLLIDINNTSDVMDVAEVQFRKTGTTNFTSLATMGTFVGTERVEVVGIEEDFYDIRARATNSLGVHGAYNTVSNFFVDPLGAPPANVTNFSGNLVGTNLYLSWTPVADLDLAHYIVRYSQATVNATYESSVLVAEVPSSSSTLAVSDAGTGTYFIKAVDDTFSGSNASTTAAQFVTTSAGLEDLNVVATVTEGPTFTGVKTNVEKDSDGHLILAREPFFDSATGLFDARSGDFDDFDNFATSGIYYFTNSLDLGAKFTSRLNYSLTSTRFDKTSTFDSATGFFEGRPGLFDDGTATFDDTSVALEMRHTLDNPASSPTFTDWKPFSVSDITARAFEFRVNMSTTNPNATPVISALAVNVDMPDRVTSGQDITFTGTTNITFTDAFNVTPAIGISLADLANGDRYTITNKSRTGFTMNTFTGGSASTNAVTLDFVAKGYGKEIT